jgi:acyl-coenzyme A thioesterase PaaI-like protein
VKRRREGAYGPIWNAKILASAEVTKRTRPLRLIEGVVEDEGGSLVAKVFGTCRVLRGEAARGR